MRAQDRRFLSLGRRPGPSSTGSARERHQPPTSARRQRASRAAPLAALGRRPPLRPTPGAGWGGYRSLPFDSHRFLVGGSGLCRSSTEQLGGSGGSGGSSGASRGGAGGAAATASCGADAARRGRERAAGGHDVAGPAAKELACVRRPCRCSALVCVRVCSYSRGADRRCCVCIACVCAAAGMRPEAARWAPTRPRAAEQAASDACTYENIFLISQADKTHTAATVTEYSIEIQWRHTTSSSPHTHCIAIASPVCERHGQ